MLAHERVSLRSLGRAGDGQGHYRHPCLTAFRGLSDSRSCSRSRRIDWSICLLVALFRPVASFVAQARGSMGALRRFGTRKSSHAFLCEKSSRLVPHPFEHHRPAYFVHRLQNNVERHGGCVDLTPCAAYSGVSRERIGGLHVDLSHRESRSHGVTKLVTSFKWPLCRPYLFSIQLEPSAKPVT